MVIVHTLRDKGYLVDAVSLQLSRALLRRLVDRDATTRTMPTHTQTNTISVPSRMYWYIFTQQLDIRRATEAKQKNTTKNKRVLNFHDCIAVILWYSRCIEQRHATNTAVPRYWCRAGDRQGPLLCSSVPGRNTHHAKISGQ